MNQPTNPYEVPKSVASETEPQQPISIDTNQTVVARFVFSADHFVVSMKRYRQQAPYRTVWKWIRWVAASCMVAVAVMAILTFLFISGEPISLLLPALLVLLAWVAYYPEPLNNASARRRVKKSPHLDLDQEFRVSPEGIYMKSRLGESRFLWSAFHAASIMEDGIIIFHSAKLFYWIPDHSLTTSDGPKVIRQLCKENLKTSEHSSS